MDEAQLTELFEAHPENLCHRFSPKTWKAVWEARQDIARKYPGGHYAIGRAV